MDPANRRYDLPGLQPDRPALLPGAEVGARVGAVFTMLKLECLLAHLAWYWISVEDHIRETTNEMLLAAMKWTLRWSVWPQQLRSWAHQL
jgi:hypothetical protein